MKMLTHDTIADLSLAVREAYAQGNLADLAYISAYYNFI